MFSPAYLVPTEVQKRCQFSWKWSCRQLWAAIWILGTQPRFQQEPQILLSTEPSHFSFWDKLINSRLAGLWTQPSPCLHPAATDMNTHTQDFFFLMWYYKYKHRFSYFCSRHFTDWVSSWCHRNGASTNLAAKRVRRNVVPRNRWPWRNATLRAQDRNNGANLCFQCVPKYRIPVTHPKTSVTKS